MNLEDGDEGGMMIAEMLARMTRILRPRRKRMPPLQGDDDAVR